MLALPRYVDLPAHALMLLLFLLSDVGKLNAFAATQGYMKAFGIPGILVWPSAAWGIGGGILLLIELWTRPLALLLAGWCLLTAFIFHTVFSDQMQMVNFLKNMTMAGGFLLLARTGASELSIDGLFSPRGPSR